MISRRKALLPMLSLPGALLFSEHAKAGGQLEEPMIDSVRTALSSAVANQAPPVPEFKDTESRLKYLRWLTAMSPRYRPFWELTRAGLRFAAARLGLALSAEHETQLLNQYRHLSAFPENKPVLQALKARGIETGILSNGDPEMLGIAVRSAGFEGLFDHVISADAVQRYKTDPATYALGTKALGKPARQILFVSSNGWDAIGATWFGYTTLWVNRAKLPLEALDTEPTQTGSSLRDVLRFFPEHLTC